MRCHPERQWRGITPPGGGGGASLPSSNAGASSQFTLKEREVAAGLLMLSGARPAPTSARKGKAKRRLAATAAAPHHPPQSCDDHKCAVCHLGFASGQALGGHKRCHWDRSCAVATAGSSTTSASSPAAKNATALDLNLPPPLPQKNLQDCGLNDTLDLKLGLLT
uniref:C2H2-type domain-containing protein n=2 Tax=Oryza brachyantha TaxID=4533 RepID=J3LBZ2_ORYBR